MNRTNNVQRLGNLKPLLRTKTVECVSGLLNCKHSNRLSSSNDGDRINDEKFDNTDSQATTSTAAKTDQQSNSTEKNKNVNSKIFIEINLFGPKDIRLPLPGNVGFIPEYLKTTEMKQIQKKLKKPIENEFKLLIDHNPSSKGCLTSTIELNLNNYETNEDRQNRVVENVAYNQKIEKSLEVNQTKFKNLFFVKVYSSTQFLLSDIKQIFPKECLFEKDFVVISVYKNPFSKITDVNLKEEFVNLANCISDSLNKMGCWTNFLEPDRKRFI